MKIYLIVDKEKFLNELDKNYPENTKPLYLTPNIIKAFEFSEDEICKVIEWDFKQDREKLCVVSAELPEESIHRSLQLSIFNQNEGQPHCIIDSFYTLSDFLKKNNV